MNCFLATLLLAAAPRARAADAPRIDRIEIVDKGTMDAEVIRKDDAADSPSGAHVVSRNIHLVKAGPEVDAKVGVRFGFHFKVVGAPSGQVVELKDVVRFPKAGIRDADRKKTFYQEVGVKRVRIGDASAYRGYLLEKEWELVPGEWVFELWSGEKRLARETFVLKRAKRPAPAQ